MQLPYSLCIRLQLSRVIDFITECHHSAANPFGLRSSPRHGRKMQRSKNMRAVVYKGPFQVAVEQVADPKIEHPNEALVRVTSTCICGSDLHMYEGRTAAQQGLILGHENM